MLNHFRQCPTPCHPMDCSPPGSSFHWILQARILEWVAMPSSRESSNPGIEPESPASPALQVDSLPTEPPGKPLNMLDSNITQVFSCLFNVGKMFYYLKVISNPNEEQSLPSLSNLHLILCFISFLFLSINKV